MPCNTSHSLLVYFNPKSKNHLICHTESSLSFQREPFAQGLGVQKEGQCSSGHGANAKVEFVSSHAQRLSCTPALITPLSHCPLLLDGFTHWSLTGTLVTDEDTFMGFNDGLSQSGIWEPAGQRQRKGKGLPQQPARIAVNCL